MLLHRTVLHTPIGPLTIIASDIGVRAVLWPGDDAAGRVKVPDEVRDATGDADDRDADDRDADDRDADDCAHAVLAAATAQLTEYFAGTRTEFDLPLDAEGTPFQHAVWDVLRTIPYGTTISYGTQARELGDARKARAVGSANGRNPISVIVPCHRVVGADGSLTGFAAGTDVKAWLLDHEQRILARSR